MSVNYEAHKHSDPNFPVIFHLDCVTSDRCPSDGLHWHESVELLFCIEGEGTVISNADHIRMRPGELVVVNSDHIHATYTEKLCRYYCLILDKSLFPEWDSNLSIPEFQNHITDDRILDLFSEIIDEMETRRPYYKSVVKSTSALLFAVLCRNFMETSSGAGAGRNDNRIEIVKSAIRYLQQHYCEDISIEDVCRHIGFSKYYFCHTFKEITGRTAINYLNFLRCQNARSLLSTGQYNISESAALSGFHNMSYFTRTYKSQMGMLPSHPAE